ncbi:NAD(P)H-hydrate dehydratase [Imbroritus primus]|uniref:NAD(P)H-hydrate dehydratase n=1 Tax=Imbroritus primus TaxID=3058603 RepID=UPI003D160C92
MDTPTPLYLTRQIRAIEAAAFQREPSYAVMTRAGRAAARWLDGVAPGGGTLLFVAGPGNNGGDALVAATMLHRAGRAVRVWLLAPPERLPADASQAWHDACVAKVPTDILPPPAPAAGMAPYVLPAFPPRMSAIVDGLLGIGLSRAVEGDLVSVIEQLNHAPVPRFALDIPSGLQADTGVAQQAIRATATLTFIGAKPGLYTGQGRDFAGTVSTDDLGLPLPDGVTAEIMLNGPACFAHALPARLHASHKGSYGSLAIIGGDAGMCGAPLLSARAALRLGAGRVHVGFLNDAPPAFDVQHPELMLRAASQIDRTAMDAIVLGPGMGQGTRAQPWLDLLNAGTPRTARHVLDADALNLLAQARTPPHLNEQDVLTPHPLEAARLLSGNIATVQTDRLAAARALSKRYGAVSVLKGSGTVVAAPDGRLAINPTGNAALATAGTGDVLAGMTGALLAQGMPGWEAALAAVWLHGAAADRLVAQGAGMAGLAAGDLACAARAVYRELVELMQGSPGL